jgi:tRNA pseudouridine38-40 synthase
LPERKIALLVEYQGTAYGGSQYQENAPTVQGTLERALSKLTGESIRVAMAGRTDAGVHARAQVAAFNTHSRHGTGVVQRAANALLPPDIAVLAAVDVPASFNPRRDARSRWYRYDISLRPVRPALMRQFRWHVREPLDTAAMARSARLLEGDHDFAAFTAPSEARRSVTRRQVYSARFIGRSKGATFDIEANAFLPHMVRRIVGTLVDIGAGRMTEQEFAQLIEEAPPGKASRTAPPSGLCLVKVRYESGLFDEYATEDV